MGDLNMPLKVVLQAKRQPTYITGISDALIRSCRYCFVFNTSIVGSIVVGYTLFYINYREKCGYRRYIYSRSSIVKLSYQQKY